MEEWIHNGYELGTAGGELESYSVALGLLTYAAAFQSEQLLMTVVGFLFSLIIFVSCSVSEILGYGDGL